MSESPSNVISFCEYKELREVRIVRKSISPLSLVLDSDQNDKIKRIQQSVDRINKMVQDLKTLHKN